MNAPSSGSADRVDDLLAVVSEASVRFSRCSTPSDVYAVALDGISAVTGTGRCSLLLFDPDGVLRFKAWRGISDEYRAAVEGHTPWAPGQREPEPIVVSDAHADASIADLRPTFDREGIR